MEGKKISFGFMKTKKAEKPKIEENIEYIACVEEKSIKVIGDEKVEEKLPIVIPMKPNTLVTAEKLLEIAEKVEKGLEDVMEEKAAVKEEIILENETLDQMAVRELIAEAKKEVKVESKELTLPIPDKLIAEGAKESTLEDYESIPVQDFGLAMLRGMGWDPNQQKSNFKQPELRPKGLGLGADKIIKANQKKKTKEEEELLITKNSYVKITTGKYSGYYGKVLSLDEENGRVMVDVPIKKETICLSEFMMQAVTKLEYDREAKVINKETYDAYKQKEGLAQTKNNSNNDPKPSIDNSKDKDTSQLRQHTNTDIKISRSEDKCGREYEKQSNERDLREDDKVEERHRRDKYCSSNSSSSPDRSRHRNKHKSKRRQKHDTNSSDSEKKYRSKGSSEKRDIDKKRKGKKKKRDRDRSPSHRKYRK